MSKHTTRKLKVRLKALSPESLVAFRFMIERLWCVLDRETGRTQPFVGETGDLKAAYEFIELFEALEKEETNE